MSKELISIIVPVYNIEKYLDICIGSIVGQSYSNLEIILVDDGSTDKSGEICDRWKEKDDRIEVIHKENGGLSSARNAGLDVSTGSYIYFVDGDDFIDLSCIESLYSSLHKHNGDVVACEVEDVEESYDKCNQSIKKAEREEIFTGPQACSRLKTSDMHNIGVVVWNKLYKANLWSHIRFPEGMIHEDEAVIFQVIYPASCVIYLHNRLHYYRLRKKSIMREEFNKSRFDILKALEMRIAFLSEKKNETLLLEAQMTYLHFLVFCRYLGRKYRAITSRDEKVLKQKIKRIYSEMRVHSPRAYFMRHAQILYGIMVNIKRGR